MAPLRNLQHLIFDLDDTLIDTSGEIIPIAVLKTSEAIIHAGLQASVEQLKSLRAELLKQAGSDEFFALAARRFKIRENSSAEQVIAAGQRAFFGLNDSYYQTLANSRHTKLAGEFLKLVQSKYQIHIVTSGDPSAQNRKLEISGLKQYAQVIHCVPVGVSGAKREAFRVIQRQSNLPPESYMSIGNRVDIDVAEARQLGWITCWFRHGEYRSLVPKNEHEKADYTVANWSELSQLFKGLEVPS